MTDCQYVNIWPVRCCLDTCGMHSHDLANQMTSDELVCVWSAWWMNEDRGADTSPWPNNSWLFLAAIAQPLFIVFFCFLVYFPACVHPPFVVCPFLPSLYPPPLVETAGSLQRHCVLKTFVLSIWTRPNRPVSGRPTFCLPADDGSFYIIQQCCWSCFRARFLDSGLARVTWPCVTTELSLCLVFHRRWSWLAVGGGSHNRAPVE